MWSIDDKRELMEFLLTHFNLTELKNLAFAVGVDYELFPHNTLGDFARELIKYFERRQRLYWLLQEIRKLRPDHDGLLASLIAKVPYKDPIQKVQIILPQDSLENANNGLTELAKLLGVNVNEIVLIGATLGTTRLLIGFPTKYLSIQRIIQNQARIRENLLVISLIAFESLDLLSQRTWQYAALHSPPRLSEGDLLPTISWNDAVERTRFILSNENALSEAYEETNQNKPPAHTTSDEGGASRKDDTFEETTQNGQPIIPPPSFPHQKTEELTTPVPSHISKNRQLTWYKVKVERPDPLFIDIKNSAWLLVQRPGVKQEIKENALVVVASNDPYAKASIILEPLDDEKRIFSQFYLARKELEGSFSKTGNQVLLSSDTKHVPVDIEHILGYVVGLWLEIG